MKCSVSTIVIFLACVAAPAQADTEQAATSFVLNTEFVVNPDALKPLEPLVVISNIGPNNGADQPIVVSTDPWALANPPVTRSGASCGVVGKGMCDIKIWATELGKPKSGTDCSNFGGWAFHDPNGKCYVCPIGFERTWDPVTSDTACANTIMDWFTDRRNVGLYNIPGVEEVVQKLTPNEMKAIFLAAKKLQETYPNILLVNELKTKSAQSTLLRETVKYHLLAYAANGIINQSDPEYRALEWMAAYIRNYRIYLANEALKMLNEWLAFRARGNIVGMSMDVAPMFMAMVTSAYLTGDRGVRTQAVAASYSIFSAFSFFGAESSLFRIPLPKLFDTPDNSARGIAEAYQMMKVMDVMSAIGLPFFFLFTYLVLIQAGTVAVYNNKIENFTKEQVQSANKPYDAGMLISGIQSLSKNAISEFITVFPVAAVGESKAYSAKTDTAVSLLVTSLCTSFGPFYDNGAPVCATAPANVTETRIDVDGNMEVTNPTGGSVTNSNPSTNTNVGGSTNGNKPPTDGSGQGTNDGKNNNSPNVNPSPTTGNVNPPTSTNVGGPTTGNVNPPTSTNVGGPTTGNVNPPTSTNVDGPTTGNVNPPTTTNVGGPTTTGSVNPPTTTNVGGPTTSGSVKPPTSTNVGGSTTNGNTPPTGGSGQIPVDVVDPNDPPTKGGKNGSKKGGNFKLPKGVKSIK